MLGYTLLNLLWHVFQWGGPENSVLVGNLLCVPLGMVVATAAWRVSSHPGVAANGKAAWRLIAVAYLCEFAANLLYFYFEYFAREQPYPSLSDALYLTYYPLVFAAMWAFSSSQITWAGRIRFWIDSGVVFLSGLMVLWPLVIGPHLSSADDWLATSLALVYPVGDLVLMFGFTQLMMREQGSFFVGAMRDLAIGFLFYVVADTGFSYLLLRHSYHTGDWVDIFLLGVNTMVTFAAARYRQAVNKQSALWAPAPRKVPWLQFVPYIAVALSYGLLLVQVLRREMEFVPALVVGAVGITILVLVRQILVLQENERLLAECQALMERLRHQAYQDPLTRLANRNLFREVAAAARSERRSQTVLLLDLDGFKRINDSMGHHVGDQLLQVVSHRLCICAATLGTVARLGGDEFAIMLEDADRDAAVGLAGQILVSLARPVSLQGRQLQVTASVGIASGEEGSVDDLLRNADVAMYEAKAAGKGRYAIYTPAMHGAALRRLELEADMRIALEQGQFRLQYQPVVDMRAGKITGVEALVRWAHPGLGLLLPGEFISLAEETGLILPLGRWVLREACRTARAWQVRYPASSPLTVSVNLSAWELMQADLPAIVRGIIEETGLAPNSLTLEITESLLMERTESLLFRLQALKELGVCLAIDDFGTGFSSLSYLKDFPVDIVKIDRSFVRGLARRSTELAVLGGIMEIVQALGLRTVAEGIEEVDQVSLLLGLQCQHGQGYLYSPPADADDIEQLLRHSAMGELHVRNLETASQ